MSATIPGTWGTTITPAMMARQRTVSAPRLSPDGRSLAFAMEFDGRTDLFVAGESGWPRQITVDHGLAGGGSACSLGDRISRWILPGPQIAPASFGTPIRTI